MEDLKKNCKTVFIPGIKKIQFVHTDEVESLIVTGSNTVSVTLKNTGRWGLIEGKRTMASSTFDRSWKNEVHTTLPGWSAYDLLVDRLIVGRYLVAFTDKSGVTWLAGYGTPMHLVVTQTSPETPAEYQGVEFVFSCESEFGFLKMV